MMGTVGTTTLTEFLLARIAEDEAESNDAWGWHAMGRCQMAIAEGYRDCDCGLPARVLAECESKRRIVGLADAESIEFWLRNREFQAPDAAGVAVNVFCLLALPYADHPDYRQEWAL